MTERTHRYEMTFLPKLAVKVDANGEVVCCDFFLSDTVVNCYDSVTGTFHNWDNQQLWDELGDDLRSKVMGYLEHLVIADDL